MSLTHPIENVIIDPLLIDFVENEALIGTGVSKEQFWSGFHRALFDLSPKNHALMAKRKTLQSQIDEYHIKNRANPFDASDYEGEFPVLRCWIPAIAPSHWYVAYGPG